jgi:hypothetical protein
MKVTLSVIFSSPKPGANPKAFKGDEPDDEKGGS